MALPNVQTTAAYSLDGFCTATIRFARLLKQLGHHVTLYASEENDAPCDELVQVITKEEQETLLGNVAYQDAAMTDRYPLWALSNPRTAREIGKRKQAKDFICLIGGISQKPVADAHPDLMTVEYSIGYVSTFAKFRVFESHHWRSFAHGLEKEYDGRMFDEVIPLFFDPAEFRFRDRTEKEPFALFVGRVIPKKGLGIAAQACEKAGIPLKAIGHGDLSLIPPSVQYLGALSMEERNEWMSRASVLLCPTTYVEPFGSVAVEAQMCGTPVIATDFGGFVETVEEGLTGYRCAYLGEFVRALKDVQHLDPQYIRARAERLYSIGTVKHQYQRYFDRLSLLWDQGWQTVEAA